MPKRPPLRDLLPSELFEPGELERLREELSANPYDRPILANERIERLTTVVIEQSNMIDDPLDAVTPIPFGHLNSVWVQRKDQQTLGREFWSFRSERVGKKRQWKSFSGYALFDAEAYIGHMVTDFKLVD